MLHDILPFTLVHSWTPFSPSLPCAVSKRSYVLRLGLAGLWLVKSPCVAMNAGDFELGSLNLATYRPSCPH